MAMTATAHAALQDPTRPPAFAAVPATPGATAGAPSRPRWVLSSTLVSPERRTAVINDVVVAVGDRIGGARVVDIQADTVRLRADGREVTLTLLKTDVKKPVKTFPSKTKALKRSGTP